MMCVVQKPFVGNGQQWERNELVEASQFRNADILVGQRFLRHATQDEIDTAYAVGVESDERPRSKSKGKPKLTIKKRKH